MVLLVALLVLVVVGVLVTVGYVLVREPEQTGALEPLPSDRYSGVLAPAPVSAASSEALSGDVVQMFTPVGQSGHLAQTA